MIMLKKITRILAAWTLSVSWAAACQTFLASDLEEGRLNGKMKEFFNENGFLILKDFFSQKTMDQGLEEYKEIVRSFPGKKFGHHFFDTSDDGVQGADRYFFDSADEIWPFYNTSAKINPSVMEADLTDDKNLFDYFKVMNKTGHNLHGLNPFFNGLIFKDPRLIHMAKDLGYDDPSTALFQTTIISKTQVDDSRYNAHQDGTFIGAKGQVLAYWIPLTPSTKEKGCLWGIPGSHKLPIERWYRKKDTESYKCDFVGEQPQWDLSEKVFLEVNPGDLLVFPGTFIHGSDPALMEAQGIEDMRVALTYHLGPTKDWDDLMWLKLTPRNTLYLFNN